LGRWILAEPLVENHDIFPDKDGFPNFKPRKIYDTRNSALFAILSGIFNTAYSAEEYQPISVPKGLPDDVSQEVKIWSDWFGEGGFGHSWLLLQELLEFDWHQTIKKQAMVSKKVAPLFEGGNNRFPFSQWPADEPISYSRCSRDGVTVNWIETYAESAGSEFLETTIDRLKSFGSPTDVRIVFWFDN
jgi:hypothetical protein